MRILAVCLSVALATGCVGKRKYDDALAENQELRDKLRSTQSLLAESEGRLSDTQRTVQRLAQEVADTGKALEVANRKLAAKMAEAGALAEDIESMQAALTELELRKAKADAALASFKDLVGRFQAMIDAGTLKVKVIDGRMVVELATDVLFPPGSASLSREGKAAIQEVAQVLAGIEGRQYQIAGHTDDRPIATEQFPSNWHLGAARAISVARILVDSGLDASRVSASSYAETKPVAPNRTKEGRAENRRIEIVIVPDLSDMPGYSELQKMATSAP